MATKTPAKALPRLKAQYRAEISKALAEQFGFTNPHQIPNLTKIVVNMGVGDASKDGKLIDKLVGAYPKPALAAKLQRYL